MRLAPPEAVPALLDAHPHAGAFLGAARVPPGADAGAVAFVSTTGLWMLMMVVMMLPAVYPWLKGFAALSRDQESGALRAGWLTLFGLGYFAAWMGFSLVGASLQISLRSWGLLGDLGAAGFGESGTAGPAGVPGALAAPWASLVLVAAGIYQVVPAKRACLKHCRSPLSYFLSRWRGGPAGAFRMGLSHGAFCVGCCWALMLTGLALGLMNPAWMAALTAVIAVETLAPGGDRIGRLTGAALVVWGLALLVAAA